MPIAVTSIVVTCPVCKRAHGNWPWERAYWHARLISAMIIDGGPVFRLRLLCPQCKATLDANPKPRDSHRTGT